MNKPTYQEIIDYLTSVIEHGSNEDLLKLYNAYTKQALTIEQVETKQINNGWQPNRPRFLTYERPM